MSLMFIERTAQNMEMHDTLHIKCKFLANLQNYHMIGKSHKKCLELNFALKFLSRYKKLYYCKFLIGFCATKYACILYTLLLYRYILYYCLGPNINAETVSCSLPLPNRVPGRESDPKHFTWRIWIMFMRILLKIH